MNVHLVVHRYPPDGMGGTELYTLHLAHGLAAEGHQVTVLTHTVAEHADVVVREDVHDGIPVRRLAFAPGYGPDMVRDEYDNRRVAATVRRVWEGERPDLVHVTHFGHLSTAVAEAADALGIPWLATLTDFWAICPNGCLLRDDETLCAGPRRLGACVRCITAMGPRGTGYAGLARALPDWTWDIVRRGASWPPLRGTRGAMWLAALDARRAVIRERLLRARAILCPGAHARDLLVANGYPEDLVRHAPHGILDPERLRHESPPAGGPALRLGYLGSLDRIKGAHLPIAALEMLPPELPVSLTYRGAPAAGTPANAFAGDVLSRIEASERARHDGPYGQGELPQVLHALDVLIVPSLLYENTPTVIYEAVAAGVPVIASDLGGMRELVETLRGGWLFPRGDAAALAELIRELAQEPERVRRLAEGMAPVPAFVAHLEYVLATYARILGARS